MIKSLLIEPKESRIMIDGVVQGFSHRISSHRSAWVALLKLQLKEIGFNNVSISPETIDNQDIWIIDHGMEFKGGFNIFGGANDELHHRLMRFLNFQGKIYSMHIEMPDLGDLIEGRMKTGSELFKTLDAEAFRRKCLEVECLPQIFESNSMLIGDSHSFSMYTPGYMVSRNDGQTLYGALKKGLQSYIPENPTELIRNLRFYFGNIDIRHHLARQEKPNEAVEKLVKEYVHQLQLLDHQGYEIEVVAALPIENESRKIPKTGYYKGTPFYGDWTQRNFLRGLFNQLLEGALKGSDITIYHHPDIYFNDLRELDFKVMESNRSVHLSREYYRWDFENNCPNGKLMSETWVQRISHSQPIVQDDKKMIKTQELF